MENRTGQFISERRRAIGLTQKELAEKEEESPGYIARTRIPAPERKKNRNNSRCPADTPGHFIKRRIFAGVLFLPLLLTVCMHVAYLYVSSRSEFEYIIDWLPYVFFGSVS